MRTREIKIQGQPARITYLAGPRLYHALLPREDRPVSTWPIIMRPDFKSLVEDIKKENLIKDF
jgi:hypothetical protein